MAGEVPPRSPAYATALSAPPGRDILVTEWSQWPGHGAGNHAEVLNRRLPLVLVNRNAGRVEDRTADQVANLLGERGPVEVVVTSEPDEAEHAIAALDGHMLVIAGGDGTVHDALNRLDRHGRLADVDLALVPLGSANALARGIGVVGASTGRATSSQSAAARCASPGDLVATTPTASSGTTSPTRRTASARSAGGS